MIEQREYEAFRAFPAVAGTVSPIRPIDVTTGHARVTLQGTGFAVRLQISNAQPGRGDQPHLFLPPDASFETFQTVTPDDPPTMIPAPVRWLRLIVDAGVITGGNVAESSRTGAEINERLLADIAQQQERNNADTAANLGRKTGLSVAEIGTDPGLYNIISSADAGQVWERPAGGGQPIRRRELEAASVNELVERPLAVTRSQLLSGQLALNPGQRFVQDEHTPAMLYADADAPPVDNGIVYQLSGGKRAVRIWDGGVRPEWFGAVGDGVHDDTDALIAACQSRNNRGVVLLGAGRTYRITRKLFLGEGILHLRGEGLPLWQFRTWSHGYDFRQRTTRIFVDFVPADPNDAAIELLVVGSIISNIEIEFNPALHPATEAKTYNPDWQPAQTGWAVRATAGGWFTLDGLMIRGFRHGIDLPSSGGSRIRRIHLGVYETGIRADSGTDVVRIGDIHQSIFQVPYAWDSWTEVTYMLKHLKVLVFGRMDNPVIGDVFCIAAWAGLTVTGSLAKATFERLEMDECIYGVVVENGFCDAKFGALVYQRFPEGDSAYGTYDTGSPSEGAAVYSHDGITSPRNQMIVDYLHLTNCPGVAVNVGGETTFVATTIYSANQHGVFLNGNGHARLYNDRVLGSSAGVQVFSVNGDAKWYGTHRRLIGVALPAVPAGGAVQVELAVPGLPSIKNQAVNCTLEMSGDSLLRLGLVSSVEPSGAGKVRITLRNFTTAAVTPPSAAYTVMISTR